MNGAPLALGLAALAALASVKPRGSRAAVAARAPGALESAAPGLGALRAAMVAVASEDTAYGKDYAGRADRLALHCGAVSYVVQRRYGGRVLSARVRGESHLWNRLPGGVEVDLSGSQYGGDGWRPLAKGRVEPERKTVNPRFALFEERVHEALGLRGSRAAVLSPSRRAEFDDLAEAFRKRVNGRDDRVIDAMRTFAKKHKIGVLGAGAARAVFSVPEGALKIEMGWAPFTDNRNEALLWGAAPARVAEHLVPVLAHAQDHAWLLMPEVEIGGAVSVQAQGLLDACGLTDFKYHESNVTKDGRLVDYGYVHSYSLFKECRERGQAQRAKPQPVAGSAAKKAFPRARVVAVEQQGSGPARRRVETLSCGHTRVPGWKRGRMMPLLEVGDAVACSACREIRMSVVPSMKDMKPFVDVEECYEFAQAMADHFGFRRATGGYRFKGKLRDHAWVVMPDGTILDSTHGQFVKREPIRVAKPGTVEHGVYVEDRNMTDAERLETYGEP